MIYLASPYTHESPAVREYRYRVACRVAGRLMQSGAHVFSPIAHSHPIAQFGNVPNNWEFWRKQDFPMLAKCDVLCVLKLPGWNESVGVTAEINEAARLGISVEYLELDEDLI